MIKLRSPIPALVAQLVRVDTSEDSETGKPPVPPVNANISETKTEVIATAEAQSASIRVEKDIERKLRITKA